MNVTWVTPEISARPRSGGVLRSHRLLTAVAHRHEVTVVLVGPADATGLDTSLGLAGLHCYPRPRSAWKKRALAARHGWSLEMARSWNPAAAALVASRARAGAVTVLDRSRMAPYRPPIGPCILSTQDHESALLRSLPPSSNPLRRVERAWDIRVLPNREAEYDDGRTLVVAVSAEDLRGYGGRGLVVPNGADVPDGPPEAPVGGPALFVGSLGYAPNQAGLAWWCEEVWPLLNRGTAPLRVVGQGGAAALGPLAEHPGLDVIGEVDDVGTQMRDCSLVVVPLHTGSGTRLKVLEALAWRRPVVSTSKGVEGLGLQPGREVVVADDAAHFARAVQDCWSEGSGARTLAERGRAFAMDYSWTRLGGIFCAGMEAHAARINQICKP